MQKSVLVIFFIISLISAQGYMENITRYGGQLTDLKFIGQNDNGYLFIVYTDDGRMYTILSNHVPYFNLKDSVIEYWANYKLAGVGKRDRVFYYQVVR